jgi:hypothetical protein
MAVYSVTIRSGQKSYTGDARENMNLVCWKCGASVAELPLPLSRLAECPACRAYLHVCRLCRFYDLRLAGQCQEERAEEVRDKTHANFCDWFKPKPDAYRPAAIEKNQAAKASVNALFGEAINDQPAKPEAARNKLDELFSPHGKPKK